MDLSHSEAQATAAGNEGAADVAFDTADVATPRKLPIAPVDGLAGSLERKRLQLYLVLMLADIAILFGSFVAAVAIYYGNSLTLPLVQSGVLPAFLMLPVYLTVALYNGTYSQAALTDTKSACGKMYAALLIAAALVNFIAFFAKMNAEFSRVIFVASILGSAILMTAFRTVILVWITKHWGPKAINQLVIHAGGPQFRLPFAYHIDAATHGLIPDMDDPARLDRLAKYLRNMDEVIISCDEQSRFLWAEMLKGSGRHGEIVSEFSRKIGALGVIHHDDADVSALLVSTGHLGLRSRVLKRLFDVSLSTAALLALSPVLLVVALAIKLQDGGPVFFLQRRVGRGNQFFNIYKFRSMREADARGERSAAKDDDRVTPVGRFIRRTSIDELPQLFNVVVGDMSHPCSIIRSEARRFWQSRLFWWCFWQAAARGRRNEDARPFHSDRHRPGGGRHPCAD